MNDILTRTCKVYIYTYTHHIRKDWQETSTLTVFHGYMPGIFQGFSVASAASSCSICLLAWIGWYIWKYFYMFAGGLLPVDCLIRIKLPYFEGRYDKVSRRDEVWIRSNNSEASGLRYLWIPLKTWKGLELCCHSGHLPAALGLCQPTAWSLPRGLSHQVRPVGDASSKGRCGVMRSDAWGKLCTSEVYQLSFLSISSNDKHPHQAKPKTEIKVMFQPLPDGALC